MGPRNNETSIKKIDLNWLWHIQMTRSSGGVNVKSLSQKERIYKAENRSIKVVRGEGANWSGRVTESVHGAECCGARPRVESRAVKKTRCKGKKWKSALWKLKEIDFQERESDQYFLFWLIQQIFIECLLGVSHVPIALVL